LLITLIGRSRRAYKRTRAESSKAASILITAQSSAYWASTRVSLSRRFQDLKGLGRERKGEGLKWGKKKGRIRVILGSQKTNTKGLEHIPMIVREWRVREGDERVHGEKDNNVERRRSEMH